MSLGPQVPKAKFHIHSPMGSTKVLVELLLDGHDELSYVIVLLAPPLSIGVCGLLDVWIRRLNSKDGATGLPKTSDPPIPPV